MKKSIFIAFSILLILCPVLAETNNNIDIQTKRESRAMPPPQWRPEDIDLTEVRDYEIKLLQSYVDTLINIDYQKTHNLIDDEWFQQVKAQEFKAIFDVVNPNKRKKEGP